MKLHGSGQHLALELAPLLNELVYVVFVADPTDVLLDDGALVELFGDIVRRRADDFDAALEGLMIRARADERRQERVMNVDDA